jgi:hypothetical protein
MKHLLLTKYENVSWGRALLVVVLMALSLGFVPTTPVHADPSASDPVYTHCVTALTAKKLQSACTDTDHVITYARNAASWKCDDADNAETCVVKNANKYIDKAAADKTAKTASTFKDALVGVLKDAVGSKYKSANDLGSLNDQGASGCDLADTDTCTDPAASSTCNRSGCDFIGKYVNPGIDLLTAVFGILAVISIIVGGIQFASSAGDPQKVAKGKQRITNTIIAIVCYFFLYSFLQFLIPGGIFNRS